MALACSCGTTFEADPAHLGTSREATEAGEAEELLDAFRDLVLPALVECQTLRRTVALGE